MESDPPSQRKAQLDKEEREHLEDVVADMRERAEDNVRFQLTQMGLDEEPKGHNELDTETEELVKAIKLESVDGNTWDKALEQYITGVGYTIVNRLAALRCMEVRDFIEEEVTVFKENGLTPAAEILVHEDFLLEDEAILRAYEEVCDELAGEIEILFDRSTAYSLIQPDKDTFESLCVFLNKVPDNVWRADDVLGWVYEYYNVSELGEVRDKARENQLSVEDVSVANQFYTPHWVVRMLADNSLGKRYLESKQKIEETVEAQKDLSTEERQNRTVGETESVSELSTYLFINENETPNKNNQMDDPSEIRVIDPACGSGHFLLYAFDILERIWWQERPEVDREKVPIKIIENNLYGIDIDRRATQLAAFNLYLKGREKAEKWGGSSFSIDTVGIVCADSSIADMSGIEDVIDDVASDQSSIREALNQIMGAFENIRGLGSLLDVQGTLSEEMFQGQTTLLDSWDGIRSLSVLIDRLKQSIGEQREEGNLLTQDLHSFLRLLQILTQEYDVALMNPPYGSQRRMPDTVKQYVKNHYDYYPEYYINFFEVCQSITKSDGRIGMLVPRSFMFRRTFRDFREDFVGERGSFDFLTEFGKGVLDNATVRTVGTVVRSNDSQRGSGTFVRLYDVETKNKEKVFTKCLSGETNGDVRRIFEVPLAEFSKIPWTPISYTLPQSAREIHGSEKKMDPSASDIDGEGIADIAQGLGTGDNDRFVRQFWEAPNDKAFKPYAKGGAEAWIMPNVDKMVNFGDNGQEMRPLPGSRIQNSRYYGREGLTWTYIKATGRRFGYLPAGSIFDQRGPMCFPDSVSPWLLMSVLNSTLYHGLFLSLTPEREWTVGDLGRIPWVDTLENAEQLIDLAREQYQIVKRLRSHNITSPYYIGPALVPEQERSDSFYQHPYNNQNDNGIGGESRGDYKTRTDRSIRTTVREIESWKHDLEQELERLADKADEIVYKQLGIDKKAQDEITTEIELRTGVETNDNSEDLSISEDNIRDSVAELLHYCVLEEIQEEPSGIIPIHKIGGISGIANRVVERLEGYFGEHATSRLGEIDEILGAKQSDQVPYPNIQEWVRTELFEFHMNKMKNTPILWRISTQRLVSNPTGEGFACYVDYHSLSSSSLDRLQTQYIEPRKVELREQKSAAGRRRNDDSLSTNERSDAAKQYELAVSGLEQIEIFEQRLQELASVEPREWPKTNRELARELKPKVEEFREKTQQKIKYIDRLQEIKNKEWFENRFSPTFLETIEENREEWISGLKELEKACDAYSQEPTQPVEAHLYDLFSYFEDLIGSDHYSSNGILFMTYYLDREGEEFLDDEGKPREGLIDEEAKLLANLANELDTYKSLANKINEECTHLHKNNPGDWESRALSEITTDGYQPNRKHGVSINIRPLAEADIVPELVEDKVI